MSLGIDYSFARPDPNAIKAQGFDFVCRYVASSAGKRISKAEADALRAAGLSICLVFEDFANPRQNGAGDATVTGQNDARLALSQANAIGFPDNRPIYFAVDYDAPESDQAWIDAYLRGAASVIGANRVGVYGGFYIVKRCAQNGSAQWFWQTLAWSGGQQYSGNHIYQNGNSAFQGGADINESKKTDFGQWGDNMADKINQDTSRILRHGILGRNGLRGRAYALDGSDQPDHTEPWLGADITNEFIQDIFLSPEGRQWRDSQDSNSVNGINAQLDTTTTLYAENVRLKAQLATAPSTPNDPSDTTHLNALGVALRWLIQRLGLK